VVGTQYPPNWSKRYSDFNCNQEIKPKLIPANAHYGEFYVCCTHHIYRIPKFNFATQLLHWISDAHLKKKYFLLKKIMVKRAQNAVHFATNLTARQAFDKQQ
jgi:hypothetical protein